MNWVLVLGGPVCFNSKKVPEITPVDLAAAGLSVL